MCSVYTSALEHLAELYENLCDAEDAEVMTVRAGKRQKRGTATKLAKRYCHQSAPTLARHLATCITAGGEEPRPLTAYSAELWKSSFASADDKPFELPRCIGLVKLEDSEKSELHGVMERLFTESAKEVADIKGDLKNSIIARSKFHGIGDMAVTQFYNEPEIAKLHQTDLKCPPLLCAQQAYELDFRAAVFQHRYLGGHTLVVEGVIFSRCYPLRC